MNTYNFRGIPLEEKELKEDEYITTESTSLDNGTTTTTTTTTSITVNKPNNSNGIKHVKYTREGFRCPDCPDTVFSCKDCYRYLLNYPSNMRLNLPSYHEVPLTPTIQFNGDIPAGCIHCPNHPSNGGSGICHCIIGNTPITC